MSRYLLFLFLPAVGFGQYVDARNLLEVLQDDLDTAKVHAHLRSDQRRAADDITLQIVKAAAKQKVHKPYDKSEIRAALKKLVALADSQVFVARDVNVLKQDIAVVELGLEGKVDMDAPRRAPGSVY